MQRLQMQVGGRLLTLETGLMAKQADGAVLAQYGDTTVLVTAAVDKNIKEDCDFLPLTVNYIEKHYAAGKIPGGFFKREGKPSDKEVLTSRLIDRPIRPLFPGNLHQEIQVIAMVLSVDQENDPDIVAIIGASAALTISSIPFNGPIAGVRVGKIDGQLVVNPTYKQLENSPLNMVVVGTEHAIVMVEGGCAELPESEILDAIFFAHTAIKEIVQLQKQFEPAYTKPKFTVAPTPRISADIEAQVRPVVMDRIREAILIPHKHERQDKLNTLYAGIIDRFAKDDESQQKLLRSLLSELEEDVFRLLILDNGQRADGRKLDEVRPITGKVGLLPRTHGSALFTRGETQALSVTTLGTASDEQKIDNLEGEVYKSFMLHYNFPPFSVGEVSPLRSPGRREVGHGNLAERAIKAVVPQEGTFPYTIRVVSDILESNGSSSMATVCGASLSLMDAGVPIKSAVSGIAMGLISDGSRFAVLSDIMGMEDHCGDMDFKVAGTRQGVTAIQMDIKIEGASREIIQKVLEQSHAGRMHILGIMDTVLSHPRPDISPFAPRIITTQVKPDKVREVIGPGGKVIRGIIEQTGVEIDIEDDGRITIASVDEESAKKALKMIQDLTEEVVVGKVYLGKVKRLAEFGAFVEILPNTDGLLHISQIANYRVEKVEDELKVGDEIMVKVIEVDRQGRIRLSHKAILQEEGSHVTAATHK